MPLSGRPHPDASLARAGEQRPGLPLDELRSQLHRHRPSREVEGIDASSDARPRLEHPDGDPRPGELLRGCEPRGAGADHDHVHALVWHGRSFLQNRGRLVLAGSVVERPALVQSTVLSRAAAGVLVRLLQALPSGTVDALARAVASCAYAVGIRRRVTLDNLARAFPERSIEERRALARAAYANMARVVVDALRSLGTSRAQLLAEVEVDDFGPVERALAAGKGLLVATAHLGSWEMFGAAMAQRVPLHAVVRPLRGGVNARLVEARERAGLRLIPARGALAGMVAALRKNEVVAMLLDQATGGKHALFVPFFGRPAATTPALSLAALRTGAPTLVVVALRENGRLRFRVEGPFEVTDTGDRQRDLRDHTARVTAALERIIREAPEQWLWLHRRWKLTPPPGPPA